MRVAQEQQHVASAINLQQIDASIERLLAAHAHATHTHQVQLHHDHSFLLNERIINDNVYIVSR